MPRLLIVNADDFGYTSGVTQGIIQAHKRGIVTSASLMVNMPLAAEAAELARREAPMLGLGLHLNLTAGRPLLSPEQVPALVRTDGTFHPSADLIARLPSLDMSQVESELRAQIARFSTLVGLPPDHLDSHHHITYLSPPLLALTLRIASELGVPVRFPLPDDPVAAGELLVKMGLSSAGGFAEEMAEVLIALVRSSGVRYPDRFFASFYGEQATLGDLLNLLVALPEGVSEMMCHPAEADDDLRVMSSYVEPRTRELSALTHPSARELIFAEGIQLICFRDLAG
jgi:predicted glycoside hydrolase/deacetylase ChbG (UPF0249 family)